MVSNRRIVAALVLAALSAAGCGGGLTGTGPTASSPQQTSAGPLRPPSRKPPLGLSRKGPSSSLNDVDWINPQRGWALASTACAGGADRCAAVYGTRDTGRTWSRLASLPLHVSPGCVGADVCAIRFATARIGYLYGPRLLMTKDGGRRWAKVPGPPTDSLAISVSKAFRTTYQGTGCPGPCSPSLQSSQIGGRSWSTLPGFKPSVPGGFGEQVLAGNANVYVVFYGHIAGGVPSHATIEVSHDHGRSWSSRPDPCGYAGAIEEDTAAASAAGDSLAVLCVPKGNGGSHFTALSTDAGATFVKGAPLHVTAPEQIAVHRDSIAVGNGGVGGSGRFDYELALSHDGGRSWQVAIQDHEQVPHPAGAASLQFINARDLYWVGDPRFVWRSSDGGRTWNKNSAPQTSSTSAPARGRTCVLARTKGDFDGDGSSDVAKLIDVAKAGTGCKTRSLASSPPRLHIRVRFASGRSVDTKLKRCDYGPCDVIEPSFFTATDLDGDGRSELALEEGPGAVIQTVGLFRVSKRGINPLRLAPAKTKRAGLKPGPATLGGNFDATYQSPVACRVRPNGNRVLVQMQREMVGNSLEGPWRIKRADLKLHGNTLHVVRVSSTRIKHGSHGPAKPFQLVCP